MLFGSVLIMLLFAVIMFCPFIYTAKREASYLQHLFGAEYDNYARNTPLFWPKFSRLQNDPEVIISTYTARQYLSGRFAFGCAHPTFRSCSITCTAMATPGCQVHYAITSGAWSDRPEFHQPASKGRAAQDLRMISSAAKRRFARPWAAACERSRSAGRRSRFAPSPGPELRQRSAAGS